MQEIIIYWYGPYSIEEIIGEIKVENEDIKLFKNKGLYQIYGFHPLYGNDVLLYIGKTEEQSFTKRLKNRYEIDYNSDSKNTKIYLGTITNTDKIINENEEIEYINISESLLINALKPAYNSSNVKSANKKLSDKEYIVYNEGNYKAIYPILSSKYFWKSWKNYEVLEKIAKIKNKKLFDDKENEEYGFWYDDEEEKIWVGVNDYIWEQYKIPLQIAVSKENKKVLEKLGLSEFEGIDDFLYINAIDDLKKTNVESEILELIEEILKEL